MALIKCSECGSNVSELAKACPNCGAPINDKETTIQFTSKNLKAYGCLSYIVMGIGFLIIGVGAQNKQEGASNIGFYIFGAGLIGLVITKISIWWHHD